MRGAKKIVHDVRRKLMNGSIKKANYIMAINGWAKITVHRTLVMFFDPIDFTDKNRSILRTRCHTRKEKDYDHKDQKIHPIHKKVLMYLVYSDLRRVYWKN